MDIGEHHTVNTVSLSVWLLNRLTLDRLISEYGTRIVHAVDGEGTPIFWNAVVELIVQTCSSITRRATGCL